jgi:hypothetical protein
LGRLALPTAPHGSRTAIGRVCFGAGMAHRDTASTRARLPR